MFNIILTSGVQHSWLDIYMIQSEPPDKSSTHSTPHIVIMILFTIFPVLHFIFL